MAGIVVGELHTDARRQSFGDSTSAALQGPADSVEWSTLWHRCPWVSWSAVLPTLGQFAAGLLGTAAAGIQPQ